MINKFRDITIIKFGEKTLTVACDSCAGVGSLSQDIVIANGYITGYRTAFVPLAETLALGSVPFFISNTLSVSMDGYGKELLRGIKAAALEAGISDENAVTGSSEDNFAVPFTSLGITVIGELTSPLPSPISSEFDIYLAGLPKVGNEVLKAKNEILSFDAIKNIRGELKPIDFIPVGSKGIAYEISQMEQSLSGVFFEEPKHSIDLLKSAGPATCALFASSMVTQKLIAHSSIPIQRIGAIKPK